MKKIFTLLLLILSTTHLNSSPKINSIIEGNINAKIHLIIYESLTCGHCASFHENIYYVLVNNIEIKIKFFYLI